ncbi:MAG: ACT domain-containing protein, partial [Peptococcaceae bacterium]|nr:ACT domain-containing protein [Peptococcaceae bacterium]
NSVKIELRGKAGRRVVVTGSSVGGGKILITNIDDFAVELSGDYHTVIVIHLDQPGVVAQITTLLAAAQVNIAQMRLSRQKRGALALTVLETDQEVQATVLDLIRAMPAVNLAMTAKPLV